jgi:hypothetical protein
MLLPKRKSELRVKKEIIEFSKSTCSRSSDTADNYSCGTHHRSNLVFATCHNNAPRATIPVFFNENLTLYIFARPGGYTSTNKLKSCFSAAIYQHSFNHSLIQKNLQIFYTAALINIKNEPRVFKTMAKTWNRYVFTEKPAKFKRREINRQAIH